MEEIVSLEWLAGHLNRPNIRVIDCRFQLGSPKAGRESYERGHIPHAFYFDLEEDLSSPVGKHGGRHPLPDLDLLADKLGKAGIDADTAVVLYDDQGGPFASRLWWLLRYMGHKKAAVLDGGYSQWVNQGYPVTTEKPVSQPKVFQIQVQKDMLVRMEEVKAKLGEDGVTIIDSRDAKRYRGEEEPIDPAAGHIPGAVNYFWKDSLAADGHWKSAEELRTHFSALSPEDEIIVYCGSGVTACPNVLSLHRAGFKKIRLYAGSWSDWVSYAENPIEKSGM
jgi:thiosulfate/3-mercaptopyruvate sulfurtransferase